MRLLLEQTDGAHDLPRLAIAALRHTLGEPRPPPRMRGIRPQALDRCYGSAGDLGDLRLTGERTFTVNVDHAGPTQSGAAPELRAGEFELFANDPQKRSFGGCVASHRLAVDAKLNSHALLLVGIGDFLLPSSMARLRF